MPTAGTAPNRPLPQLCWHPRSSSMVLPFLFYQPSSFSTASRAFQSSLRRNRLYPRPSPLSFCVAAVGGKFRSFFVAAGETESSHPSLRPLTRPFEVTAPYEPTGDQPEAIRQLIQQLEEGDKFSTLRGITGTGKTFVMSHVICHANKPTLVLCHNKTLAAQLARELRSFLKKNAVELFVSYYNYFKPEAFLETTGKYFGKKSSVNEEIDALRHRATRALLERRDVVIVASVSCIYGLGLPAEYLAASTIMTVGDTMRSLDLIANLEKMLYTRPEDPGEMLRGNYQLAAGPAGHVLSIWPPQERFPLSVRFNGVGDTVQVSSIDGIDFEEEKFTASSIRIFPAKHHVFNEDIREEACLAIEAEMRDRVQELNFLKMEEQSKRLQMGVSNDLILLRETGFCNGAENYSRHFSKRAAGEAPDTLIDYLKMSADGDWLLIVDESHVTLPQLKTMYRGDRSRKEMLVKHGFRLPSAMDNRPLQEEEFWKQVGQAVFVSATPANYELEKSQRPPVEMVIRPTFICDPEIDIRPSRGQLTDLVNEIKKRASRNERTLAMAISKRDAEDLATFLGKEGVLATFIHCDLTTHERSNAIRSLQNGEVDCLVGINLLREGLDLPQVSLVAILNADSAGLFRSHTALLQTIGRAARNSNGAAIFYADRITDSMQKTIEDTKRRREKQLAYNEAIGCKPISTEGSTMMSIFDLLRDEIKDQREQTEAFDRSDGSTKSRKCLQETERVEVPLPLTADRISVVTGNLPSKPGVYFWKDGQGNILYIGKAKKLRNRVQSYLSPNAKHSSRIKTMIAKSTTLDFVLTPSVRDALILESNLIKHHQPLYNVLLKDDETYPYICASIGDKFPRFFSSPRRQTGEKASKYRYFGPYPHFQEINALLGEIEETYSLRAKSFAARHGDCTQTEYAEMFNLAMVEVFEAGANNSQLVEMRSEYEEANLLFTSADNKCRDVVAIGHAENDENNLLVHVVQMREGLVAGRFSYSCELQSGFSTEEDMSAVIQAVLERQHYPSGEESGGCKFTFFPDEILSQFPIENENELKKAVKIARTKVEPNSSANLKIRNPATRGPRKETDARALEFALGNANQAALEWQQSTVVGATRSSIDGTAMSELVSMLCLEKPPRRIECYDISHTQGEVAVGSRVVFIDGKPSPMLYRKFNIKTVEGNNDYASLEEVLERRFHHVWEHERGELVHQDDPWALPDLVVIDGGVGQLGAAIKGMTKAGVFPPALPYLGYHVPSKVKEEDILEEEIILKFENNTHVMISSQCTHVPICALAKSKEEIFVPGHSIPVNNSPDSPGLLLLRSLRDESHRFALDAHRKRRSLKSKEV